MARVDNTTREYAVKFATERFQDAANHWESTLFPRMRDFDDYYNVRLPADLQALLSSDEQSDLVPPDIHFLTNDFRASITVPFQRAGRVARLRGIGPRDVENEAFSQALLDWNIEKTDYWFEFDQDMMCVALGGYAVGIIEERPMLIRTVKDGRIIDSSLFGGAKLPCYRHLDRYKTYFDPRAKRSGYPHMRYVCYQTYMTREELLSAKANQPNDGWDFEVDDLKATSGERTRDEMAVAKIKGYPTDAEVGDKSRAPLPVTFYVGNFHRDGAEGDPEQVIIGLTGTKLLRFKRPQADYPLVDQFQLMSLQPNDNELIGMGKVEPVEDLFLEGYMKRNQRVDAVNSNAWGVNFIERNSEVPQAHRLGNMTFVQVDDPVNMKTYQGGDTGLLFTESALIKQEIRENYGSDYSLGLNPSQRESATGATLLIESQGKNTVMAVRNLWYSGLKRHHQLRFAMLQRNCPDDVFVRLSEDEKKPLERISKEQIAGEFDFSLGLGIDDFTPDSVRQARIERLTAFYREDPDIDQYALKKAHFVANGFANASLLVVRPNEKEQLPRTETAVILRTGLQLPINDTDDDILHYQIHIQGVITGLQLAEQGKVLAENIAALQEHADWHYDRAQARYGLVDKEPSVMPSGSGKIKQKSGEGAAGGSVGGAKGGNAISRTRSTAQLKANQVAGPFQ